MIYFLHLHKCGGTFLVNHARENEVLYSEEMNGNPSAGGNPIPFWDWEPAKQREFLKRPEYTFVANEHCIGRHLIIEENIRYVTIVRDPLDRTYSHFRHEVRGYTEGASDGDPYAAFMARNGFPWFCENLLHEVPWANDYMVKQLGVSHTKKSVSSRDLKLAISRLGFFSVVASFETMASQAHLMNGFGWKPPRTEFRASESNARKALADYPAALDALYEANSLDLQLFKLCSRSCFPLRTLRQPPVQCKAISQVPTTVLPN